MILRGSLRLRLLALILLPLAVISLFAMLWRYSEARTTAQEIFDRNLLLMGFAVARDVALSGGDTLAPSTQAVFKDASGGDVFYHVYGPDGSFVTGYSSPPTTSLSSPSSDEPIQQYDATHQGVPVRVARLFEETSVDGIDGNTVVTVWQRLDQRDAFVQQTGRRAIAVVLLLLGSVAMLVLFGVGIGLRPLNELEDAIQKRSGADLSPILRQVPEETKGIVARLNSLFAKVTEAQEAQQRFVSLAAHQLRNPVAAIHTMAEATQNAQTLQESKSRADTLVEGTRNAVRLTNQLLSFERVKGGIPKFEVVDFSELLQSVAQTIAPKASRAGIDLEIVMENGPLSCHGDQTLLREALINLVENALLHGGKNISYIRVSVEKTAAEIWLTVENDGNAIDPSDRQRIFDRFSQASHDTGAGLGLSIASEIAKLHSGALELDILQPVRFILRIGRQSR